MNPVPATKEELTRLVRYIAEQAIEKLAELKGPTKREKTLRGESIRDVSEELIGLIPEDELGR